MRVSRVTPVHSRGYLFAWRISPIRSRTSLSWCMNPGISSKIASPAAKLNKMSVTRWYAIISLSYQPRKFPCVRTVSRCASWFNMRWHVTIVNTSAFRCIVLFFFFLTFKLVFSSLDGWLLTFKIVFSSLDGWQICQLYGTGGDPFRLLTVDFCDRS